MKYRLRNNTSISNVKIHKIIRFCCPKGLDNFVVIINKARSREHTFDGEAYCEKNKITIELCQNLPPMYSHQKILLKFGYVCLKKLKNVTDILVYLIAHELRHLWQYRISKQDFFRAKAVAYKAWNGEYYFPVYKAEKDASIYGGKQLDKWRKL